MIAAHHTGEAFVIDRPMIRHADLTGDRVGGRVADGGKRVDVAYGGIAPSLRQDAPRRFRGNALSLMLRHNDSPHFVRL